MLKFKEFPWADVHFDEMETIEGKPRLYITPDGNFPSMTSILSVLDDGGIEKWRQRVGEEEADRITQEAADRGNALHDYNEAYLNNNLKRSDLKGPAKILFNRVKNYLDEIECVVATEVPLYHKEDQYAGRVDCIGMMHNEIMIIDHKNSRRPIDASKSFGRRKLFKYYLQLYGYARALERMKGIKATKGCLIVGNYLTSNSDRFFVDFTTGYLEEQFKIALHAYLNNGEGINNSEFFKL